MPTDGHPMNHPHNVLFGPDNNLYVTNVQEGEHSVLRFDGRSGKYLGVFVDGKNPKIGYPSDIVFTQNGGYIGSFRQWITGRCYLYRSDSEVTNIDWWLEVASREDTCSYLRVDPAIATFSGIQVTCGRLKRPLRL
jgi:hypothetical protein